MSATTCARCKGNGCYTVRLLPDSSIQAALCSGCLGEGTIGPARAEELAAAQELYDLRARVGLSLHDASALLGVALATLCRAENANVDPRPLLAVLRERAHERLAGEARP